MNTDLNEAAVEVLDNLIAERNAYREAWNKARQLTDARWYQVNSGVGRSAISDVLRIQQKLAREHGLPEAGDENAPGVGTS